MFYYLLDKFGLRMLVIRKQSVLIFIYFVSLFCMLFSSCSLIKGNI